MIQKAEEKRPLKVLVADDEPLARRHLVQSLEKIDNVELCAQCSNGQEALKAVQRYHVTSLTCCYSIYRCRG